MRQPSPRADVTGVGILPVQCRCGRGAPSPVQLRRVRVCCEQYARVAADGFVGAGRPSPTPGLLDAINPTVTARFVALGARGSAAAAAGQEHAVWCRARVRCRDSQSTFIFPFEHEDGHLTFIWMADRWNANGPGNDPYALFRTLIHSFGAPLFAFSYPCSQFEHPYSHFFSHQCITDLSCRMAGTAFTNNLPDKLGCRRPRQHDIRMAAARPALRTIAVEALGRLEAAARGM